MGRLGISCSVDEVLFVDASDSSPALIDNEDDNKDEEPKDDNRAPPTEAPKEDLIDNPSGGGATN